jgi:drug/metabolite transporter (DMT)-like permease
MKLDSVTSAVPVSPIEDRRLLGIAFVLVGYFCFTIIDSCAKYLSQRGLPPMEVAFVRYAAQLLLATAIFMPQRGMTLVTTRAPWLEVLRGLCLMGSTIANFFAITFLPLTTTSSIMFTQPLILCALSIPFLGEIVGWRRWLAILIGFCGVLVIVHPGSGSFHPAVLLSLCAAACGASYMLLTRRLAGVDSAATQQFYSGLVATACIAPFLLAGWTWPQSWDAWIAFFFIGVAALVGHQFLTIAHRFAPASVLAPFGYIQIIFMTASSWLVFHQPPEIWLYFGAPIVIGSGLYIWLRERQLSKSVVTEVTVQD